MTLENNSIRTITDEVRSKWGWFVALGVLLLILGGVAFGNLFIATVATVYVVGWLMLFSGVVEIIHAFGVQTWGRFFLWLASGLLYALAGIFAFYNPVLASTVLTFLLAVSLVASGALRAWVGFDNWEQKGSGWIVTAGVITVLAGIVIAIGWPVNSLWVIGLFLAVDLIFQGWSFIAFGLALKK
ncbi:HdeD family acid-resistance protein [Aquamicrobium lusatiense]|uniref:HdeD family acid-resistance protein n=1 Tax=Aquamicrobium TaxID=69278 RepID=UPI002453ED7D|nr:MULTISPECIES: HdeD family acid-resistance protein [Aquamicrobium]MCK9550750.1 HdeD family acid-resistance protein [Aquamicrobium sp.]MDH4990145.1 HdeD family acid-resistance protein [Aquamicrobium lusatiense]